MAPTVTPTLPAAAPRAVVALLAAASVAVDVADLALSDTLARAGFVALCALAGREADRRTHIIAAAFAALLAGGPLGIGAAVVSVGAMVKLSLAKRRPDASWRHPLGALSAGAAAFALCHQGTMLPPVAAAVATAVATAPLLWSGYTRLRGKHRRWVRLTAQIAGGLVGVIALAGATVALQSRSSIGLGTSSMQLGIDAARAGEMDEALDHFDQAAAAFARSRSRLDSPLGLPARLVPGVRDNLAAAVDAAEIGEDLAEAAGQLGRDADYRNLKLVDGQLDLDLVHAMVPHVDDARSTMADAEARTNGIGRRWLVEPLTERLDELLVRIEDADADLVLALDLLDVIPPLLGDDRDRTWLVLFGQPAEARYGGGFVADYAVLEASDGSVEIVEDGPITDLNDDPAARTLQAPDWYADRYSIANPTRFLQNLTVAPDFPTTADVAASTFEQIRGVPVDGVIYLDPAGIAAMLELTGPIALDGVAEPLTAENAEGFLLRDQYAVTADREERKDLLHDAGRAAFDALLSGDGPNPTRMANVLSPAVRGGHLAIVSLEDRPAEVLDDLELTGRFAPPADEDWISVRHAELDASKLNAYLRRELAYEVRIDDDGTLAATATIELHNEVPDGLPDHVVNSFAGLPYGTSRVEVAIYTPHELVRAERNGVEVLMQPYDEPYGDSYVLFLDVPRGERATIQLELVGRGDPADHAVTVLPQAGAHDQQVRVEVAAPRGGFQVSAAVPEPRRFTAADGD